MNNGLMRKLLSRNVDSLVLFYCKKQVNGYVLLDLVQKAFGARLSSATVYNSLSRLERDGLVSHCMANGKRGRRSFAYSLTEKGQVRLTETVEDLRFLVKILRGGCS